jgi:hypothetical protein
MNTWESMFLTLTTIAGMCCNINRISVGRLTCRCIVIVNTKFVTPFLYLHSLVAYAILPAFHWQSLDPFYHPVLPLYRQPLVIDLVRKG